MTAEYPGYDMQDELEEEMYKARQEIKPDKECPKCGRGMIHIPDQDRYDCTGVLDGCYYSEELDRPFDRNSL